MTTNYHKIAKNTLLLYLRMFFTLLVGLYTSRVILNVLGVSDYGLYNIVGGLVSVMTLLNGAMVGASQRYFSYVLGIGDHKQSELFFSTSLNIHILLAVVFFVIAETIGLWFLNTQLNIEVDRVEAANVVYQFTVAGFTLSMIMVPFGASIIAHEKMGFYAYVSVFEVILKLVIVFLLLVVSYDKLKAYAFLIFVVTLLVQLINIVYCRMKFAECRFRPHIERKLFKEMMSYAGWTIFGEMGFSFKDQLSNILLNLFFGTTVNAARGVAFTVNNIVNSFSANFTLAIKPQITKQYASGNINESQQLVYAGARFSFLLMSLVAIPVLINIDYILRLWLGVVPDFTSVFVYITIVCSLFYAMSQPITTAIQATGKIRRFQIGICIIMMSELPIAYLILRLGGKPYEAMFPSIITSFAALIYRFYVLKSLMPQYQWRVYLFDVVFRCLFIFLTCLFLLHFFISFFSDTVIHLIVVTISSVFFIGVFCYFVGLHDNERVFIKNKIVSYSHSKYHKSFNND